MISVSWIGCLLVSFTVTAEDVDVDLSVDRTGWKDPLDPFSTYHDEQQDAEKLIICQRNLEECRKTDGPSIHSRDEESKQSDPTLKLIIRNMLSRLNVDIDKVNYVDRTASVYLNADDVNTIRRYLDSDRESVSLREHVRTILEGIITQQDPYSEPSWLHRIGSAISPLLPLLNVLLVVPAVVVLLIRVYSTRSIVVLVLFTAFLVSLYTVYNQKYQKNVAARMALSKVPDVCQPKGILWETLHMVRDSLFIKGKSECEQYYESLLVDPLYEISPLDVLSDVISGFIFTPLGVFGRHSNAFFKEFFRDDPIFLAVLKATLMPILIVCVLFWVSGYRIRTLFATIEPAGVLHVPYDRSLFPPAQPAAIQEHETNEGGSTQRAIRNAGETTPTPIKSTSCRSRVDHCNEISQRKDNKKRSHSLGRLAL